MLELKNPIGSVTESSPSQIRVEIASASEFEANKSQLGVGQYLLIASGNNLHLLATITAVRASRIDSRLSGTDGEDTDSFGFRFQIDSQPIGTVTGDGDFTRGAHSLPVPTEYAYVTPPEVLSNIFSKHLNAAFPLGSLGIAPEVKFEIDGDRFFSKHVAIVGSTGSGKSCAVAKILQTVVGIEAEANSHKASQKNAHVVIFDIHAEYAAAFKLAETEKFTLNLLDVDTLKLPYWLMNAQELEEMFIEGNEVNSHNQISQFRHAVVRNKVRHNKALSNISFDTPVYFSIDEVVTYLENMNSEVIGKLTGEFKPKLADNTLIENRDLFYFDRAYEFVPSSTSSATKATNGPFHGEFDRLILRLRTRLADPRLRFLFYPIKPDGKKLETNDFADVVRQFIGYINKANISIVDLSGIPFEVLSIVVSLISRMIFDFGFHYSKNRHVKGHVSDVPIMVVCEEAHNYLPRSGGARYDSSRMSIERIAKEGRKYGVTLMVVSQRPSEVSETIFSQCSNFISLRLTNSIDQSYVKSLLPDLSAGIGDLLPNLGQGEFLAVGDAPLMPTIGRFSLPMPEPHSRSVNYLQEWNSEWREIDFDEVMDRWRGKAKDLEVARPENPQSAAAPR
ncbi:ATP-binding protein [Hyphomicrobiales bacterium]|uniref:ATP-binding protein n=1 Tax=Agrobacterium radiobacter TaxID=362 RepID=UPI000DD0D15E